MGLLGKDSHSRKSKATVSNYGYNAHLLDGHQLLGPLLLRRGHSQDTQGDVETLRVVRPQPTRRKLGVNICLCCSQTPLALFRGERDTHKVPVFLRALCSVSGYWHPPFAQRGKYRLRGIPSRQNTPTVVVDYSYTIMLIQILFCLDRSKAISMSNKEIYLWREPSEAFTQTPALGLSKVIEI